MCCYDWGAQHPIGFTDNLAIQHGESEYSTVAAKVEAQAKGFEAMKNLALPRLLNQPDPVVQTLADLWRGKEIARVRQAQISNRPQDLDVCRQCPFKETYTWDAV